MSTKLRVILDPPSTASFNMGADFYLLKTVTDPGQATLRLYEWMRPTISLGQMQKAEDVLDEATLIHDNVTWIKRPTGGRAVLHWNDLTYAVCISNHTSCMGGSVAETYRIISDCLIAGLERVGIESAPHDSQLDTALARTETKLPCFLAPNRDEIMVNGKKLIGSAQKRTATAVLQHGSIPFTTDSYRLPDYSNISPDRRKAEKRMFESKCTCINELKPGLLKEDLAKALIQGFKIVLGVIIEERGWTNEEISEIERLAGKAF